ncbi:MAG: BTAD domain-containing putative transcriptional regulator [Caldilineaceae bacterium]
MSILQIRLFGPGQLRAASGQIVQVQARKELAALAYLLLEGGQAQSRDLLQALLWGDLNTESARNNLRVALSRLQSLIGPTENTTATPKLLQTSRIDVQLNPAAPIWVDVTVFLELLAKTRHHEHASRSACLPCFQTLQKAVELYQAEFLAGFALADSPAFEEWLFLQRERLHVLVSDAYRDLAAYAETTEDWRGARSYAQRQIELDPLCEPAYRQQMRLLIRQGERSAALAVFERCRQQLYEELGLDPEAETLALHMQILTAEGALNAPVISPLPMAQNVPSAVSTMPTTLVSSPLPQQLTSFIGREQELEEIHALLRAGSSRLISLVGPGGIGKTRLALQVAGVTQYLFANGVHFVPLAGVQDASALPVAILDTLQVNLAAGSTSPTNQLLTRLAHQHMLLVIDNLEHLMEGVDLLLAILQAAPSVTLLVTSREQLNCQAEDCFLLTGLTTPTQSDLAHAAQTAAVRLFCDRAYRLDKEFKLTAQNCGDIVRICQLVEGLPLALELVTTWLGELDCAGLVCALTQGQMVLATTQRDLPARHRSMQAVFDYSWHLLSANEQRLLSRLALCQGRFSAQAAAAMFGASRLDLTHLRYKSLLRMADAGYYDLHPLVRSFALATLDPMSLAQAEAQIVTYYLHLVAAQADVLDGETPLSAIQTIGGELDNIHQAWQWAERHMRRDLLLQSVAGLGSYYAATGRNVEREARFLPLAQRLVADAGADETTKQLCLRLLDHSCSALLWLANFTKALPTAQMLLTLAQTGGDQQYAAYALIHSGRAFSLQGMTKESEPQMVQALAIARQLENPHLLGYALVELSTIVRNLGRRAEAETLLTENLALQRAHGNRTEEQRTLIYLAFSRNEDRDFQAGRSYLTEAVRLLQLTGNRHLEARIANSLGYTEAMLGNYAAALENHHVSRRISQEIRQPVQESHALHNLCTVQRKLGNLLLAEEYGQEALRLALDTGLPSAIHYAYLHLGYVWLAGGNLEEAATTFAALAATWQDQGRTNPGLEALVGMAAVEWRLGQGAQAAERIAPVVPLLIERVPDGADEPFEVYLTCYAILQGTGDERAPALLKTAYTQLQSMATKITDKALRTLFWQAPAHHQIRTLWKLDSESVRQ